MKNIKHSKLESTSTKRNCRTGNVSSKYFHPDPSLYTHRLQLGIYVSKTQCTWQPAEAHLPGLKMCSLF